MKALHPTIWTCGRACWRDQVFGWVVWVVCGWVVFGWVVWLVCGWVVFGRVVWLGEIVEGASGGCAIE